MRFTLPLAGRVGAAEGRDGVGVAAIALDLTTPTPNPSPQGGGEQSCARGTLYPPRSFASNFSPKYPSAGVNPAFC